jgi:hypothetical protein
MTNRLTSVIIPTKGDQETVYCMILSGFDFRRAWALAAAVFFAMAQDAAADGLRAGEWHTVQTPEINGMIGPPQKRHALPDAGSRR